MHRDRERKGDIYREKDSWEWNFQQIETRVEQWWWGDKMEGVTASFVFVGENETGFALSNVMILNNGNNKLKTFTFIEIIK